MVKILKTFLRRLAFRVIRPFLEGRKALSNPYVSGKLLPLQEDNYYYIVSHAHRGVTEPLPVPPKDLWWGYADTEEQYLSSGQKDMSVMLDILKKAGARPESLYRVLDVGCAGARMLRFYPYVPEHSELWGVDISAKHITWCQQHLSPPLLFATITTSPHLPFEDNYFDLIFCGSVFTHISDLADAWFLELRRVLRKEGYAYITIHDENTLELLLTKYRDHELAAKVHQFDQQTSIRTKDYACFSFFSDPYSRVFYDTKHLIGKWSQFAEVLSVTPEAYEYQTAILLKK